MTRQEQEQVVELELRLARSEQLAARLGEDVQFLNGGLAARVARWWSVQWSARTNFVAALAITVVIALGVLALMQLGSQSPTECRLYSTMGWRCYPAQPADVRYERLEIECVTFKAAGHRCVKPGRYSYVDERR